MHERRAGLNRPRLTVANFNAQNPYNREAIRIWARIIADEPVPNATGVIEISLTKQNRMRLYAGQPDPADASHFTIKYEIDHVPGTIDGWLQPDDTVKLQVRDGPAVSLSNPPAAALTPPNSSAAALPTSAPSTGLP